MTLQAVLPKADQFKVLILDNEVTVGEFVTNPPVCWSRLVRRDGIFRIPEGYPNVLTEAQAKFEMKNWDEVSLPHIADALQGLDESVDYVVFGNNAGQGLPLAQSLQSTLISDRAAIIYAHSLPEKALYEQLGYRIFCRRMATVSRLVELANNAGRSLGLYFINTVQHNQHNYHDP